MTTKEIRKTATGSIWNGNTAKNPGTLHASTTGEIDGMTLNGNFGRHITPTRYKQRSTTRVIDDSP